MKIGFNVKRLFESIISYVQYLMSGITNTIQNHELRIQHIEDSDWVEITSTNGQEAEITQEFSEIKMQARGTGTLYSVTCNYDDVIFHNSSSDAPTYMICGNPTENNYGCKFKYMVASDNKQYVSVDSCFSGSTYDAYEFRAWIKPV